MYQERDLLSNKGLYNLLFKRNSTSRSSSFVFKWQKKTPILDQQTKKSKICFTFLSTKKMLHRQNWRVAEEKLFKVFFASSNFSVKYVKHVHEVLLSICMCSIHVTTLETFLPFLSRQIQHRNGKMEAQKTERRIRQKRIRQKG